MTSAVATMAGERRREVVPSSVLGTLVFIGAELMFFAGLISAFTISQAGAPARNWQLPTGLMLPAAETALNTLALLASGVLVFVSYRQYRRDYLVSSARTLLIATLLGALFVVLQGREWWALLSQGLTVQSSTLGAFFYLIVGAHALHAIGAIIALAIAWRRLHHGVLTSSYFLGAQTFWYFVVGIWPVIYARVYF